MKYFSFASFLGMWFFISKALISYIEMLSEGNEHIGLVFAMVILFIFPAFAVTAMGEESEMDNMSSLLVGAVSATIVLLCYLTDRPIYLSTSFFGIAPCALIYRTYDIRQKRRYQQD